MIFYCSFVDCFDSCELDQLCVAFAQIGNNCYQCIESSPQTNAGLFQDRLLIWNEYVGKLDDFILLVYFILYL